MASKVEICNRALQLLGANSITDLTDNSRNAIECNTAYEPVKLALLREHTWNFAVARSSIAEDATAPDWGRGHAYQLPSDFVRLLPHYPEDNDNELDWLIEGKKIYTDDTAPLQIRYIYNVTDPNEMDAAFREAFSARLAHDLAETITQSNSKKAEAKEHLKDALRTAKRVNAFEKPSAEMPTDQWISKRR